MANDVKRTLHCSQNYWVWNKNWGD